MPVAILKFKLPEEQHEFDTASQSQLLKSVLWDFSNQLRIWQQYHHNFENADDAINKIREEFYRLLNEHDVNLD